MFMRYYSYTSSILEMKFTTDQYKYIIKTRDKIRELNMQETKLYDELIKTLDIPFHAEDWMFDYIYNEYGTIDDIENRINSTNERT